MLKKLSFMLVCMLLFSISPVMAVDTCQMLHDRYQICVEKENAGREMDYDYCVSLHQQLECENVGHCYWNSKTNTCQTDLALSDITFDGKVGLADMVIMKQEFLRTDGPIYTWGPPMPCTTCDGALSPLGRWCDQNNGTVKDMTTGLVWLKDAEWGGAYPFWVDTMEGVNAHDRASRLWDGSEYEGSADLSDGSVLSDWRLPTKNELEGITKGTEQIRSSQMYFFTTVQPNYYWSSSSVYSEGYTQYAMNVSMYDGTVHGYLKTYNYYVWPVRNQK